MYDVSIIVVFPKKTRRIFAFQQSALNQNDRNLLKYCGLDTYAMVKVWEKLREAAGI